MKILVKSDNGYRLEETSFLTGSVGAVTNLVTAEPNSGMQNFVLVAISLGVGYLLGNNYGTEKVRWTND